ncbi:MAG: hypothetical protein RLZZ308_543 [Candidatus Parcubacteria bacterium]|jgi:hypothetical protein
MVFYYIKKYKEKKLRLVEALLVGIKLFSNVS